MTTEKTHPKTLSSLLADPGNALGRLMGKVNHLRALNQCLCEILEPTVAKHCQVANFRDDCLILAVDSSAWMARLRLMTPELLEKLRKYSHFKGLKSVETIILK